MRRLQTAILLLAIAAGAACHPNAVCAQPLRDHLDGPIKGTFGFPDSTHGVATLAQGVFDGALSLNSASHSIVQRSGAESLTLDGETTRLSFNLRYGLGERLMVGLELPYVWHHSGNLDALIDGWHSFFGLPDGPRATRERDLLDFAYADSGPDRLRLRDNVSGLGDLRLIAGWRAFARPGRRTTLRLGIKLPTGEASALRGSGGADISVGIAGDYDALAGTEKWSGFYRADLVYLGTPDFLAERNNTYVGQLSGGIGYRAWPSVDLRVQARLRSAVFDSQIENLGEASASLTAGVNLALSDRVGLTLAFGEDIKPDSAPDISFQLALRYR